jgi:sugar transferase EpsL
MPKRVLDIVVAGLGVVLFFFPMLFIAACIWLFIGAPILFRDTRPGKDGKPFAVLKFRTMTAEQGTGGRLLPDELRLTRLGRFLRAWSLDELPQLFNVLRGDMSLVGPRPLLTEYLGRYTPEQARRHEVKPGLTGWAQVNGRNALTWDEKFALDVWYVDNWSLRLDLLILWMTLRGVLRREGISAPGHATMPHFGERDGE